MPEVKLSACVKHVKKKKIISPSCEMKAPTLCRARARKAVLPLEVLSCAVWEQWHWALDSVSGWETHPVGAPGSSFLPVSRNKQPLARVNWERGEQKVARPVAMTSEVLQEVRAGTAPARCYRPAA